MQILLLGKCECYYYNSFFVVVLQFHQWLWCGVSIALNKLFGGLRGTAALDTHGKGCNKSLNIKLLDSFEHCWLMAVVCWVFETKQRIFFISANVFWCSLAPHFIKVPL